MYLLRCLCIVLIGVLGFSIQSALADTIEDAIKHTLNTNPEIRANAHNRLARDQEVRQAKAGYYPRIDWTNSAGINDADNPFQENFYPRSSVLGLRQNIYSFGVTTNEVARQKARVRSQAYLLQANSEFLSLQAARAYLNVLRAMELHDLARENLVNHQRIHDQIKLRTESGVERKADLFQVMGRLALAESNIVVTQANLEDARTDYLAIVGLTPQGLIKPAPLDPKLPRNLEDAIASAKEDYPLVKSARADLEAREFQYKTAKSNAYPKLDLAADYIIGSDVDFPSFEEEFIASVILRVNIFNGGYDRARIAETLQQIREAKEIYNNTERQTIQSVSLSWEAYRASIGRTDHLRNYVESAASTMDAFSQQWMLGRRTMFDVLDTQAEYINAKSSLVGATYDKLFSEYRVLSAMGKLVHTLGLSYPEESTVITTQEKEEGMDVWVPRSISYDTAK